MKQRDRVSPEGRQMGANAATMAERGMKQLIAMGYPKEGFPGARGEMCPSCACRRDTIPNGCLQTQMDLLKSALDQDHPFLCHAPNNGRICAGWIGMRAYLVKMPPELKAKVQRLVDGWEYTSADSPESAP